MNLICTMNRIFDDIIAIAKQNGLLNFTRAFSNSELRVKMVLGPGNHDILGNAASRSILDFEDSTFNIPQVCLVVACIFVHCPVSKSSCFDVYFTTRIVVFSFIMIVYV